MGLRAIRYTVKESVNSPNCALLNNIWRKLTTMTETSN